MTRRPATARPRAGLPLARLAAIGLAASLAAGLGEGRAQSIESTPLADYRRIEMRVPADFTVDCRTRGQRVDCAVSAVPEAFPQLMFGLRGGTLAGVTVRPGRGTAATIRFNLKRDALRLQQALLVKPRRWVVEVGLPDVLMGPVQEQLPFRPYPMRTDDLGFVIPPADIQPVPPRSEAAQQYGACYEAWLNESYRRAIEVCGRVDTDAPDAVPGRMALKIIAESWLKVMAVEATDDLPSVIAALEAAERGVRDPLAKVRYALLAAETFESLNYLNRAELHLDTRRTAYESGPAEPYVLAARARMLMKVGDHEKARTVLEQLRALPGDAPTIGRAIVALAGLAYEESAFVVAAGLFDLARSRWADAIESQPGALFQAAETYLLYDRAEDARRYYALFLEQFPETPPFWVARVRLVEIRSYTDPIGAREAFQALAAELKRNEGQDLAFLRYAELIDEPAARRRVIRDLGRDKRSEYVIEELTVRSIQQALDDGRIPRAWDVARSYWRRENPRLLDMAPQLFDRVLYLALRERIDDPIEVLRVYYRERERFENHTLRGEMHLAVGRALRQSAMYSEAVRVMQNGLGGTTAEQEPDAAARLYRELAAVLWESEDRFRLAQIVEYLEARHPKRFDDYDYWMARAHDAWWSGRLDTARDMLVYALNGPLSTDERLDVMDTLVELYTAREEPDRALRVLDSRIALHDTEQRPMRARGRRDARWRIAEIHLAAEAWGPALAALTVFLDEYPDDPDRIEARFLVGRCLLRLGDTTGARRQWDLAAKEAPDQTFGKLALMELELLRWRQQSLSKATGRVGL